MTQTIPQYVYDTVSTDGQVNQRVAFKRRLDNVEAFVGTHINPIEEQILLLREQLIPLYDQLGTLRNEAKQHCTHSQEFLTVEDMGEDYHVRCKFCDTKFIVLKQQDVQ